MKEPSTLSAFGELNCTAKIFALKVRNGECAEKSLIIPLPCRVRDIFICYLCQCKAAEWRFL